VLIVATVHAIGTPENDSERVAISYLAERLPDNYAIFHNLELPTNTGLPYEYDIIIIGEFAVYVLEVKGYGGQIRGNAHEWEFESGAIHRSPIPLANKKAKVLAERIRRGNRALTNTWVQPIIALTDDRVQFSLNDDQSSRVMKLTDIPAYVQDRSQLPSHARPVDAFVPRITKALFSQFKPLRRQHQIQDYRIIETIGNNDLYTTVLAEHAFVRTRSRFVLKVYSIDIYAAPEDRDGWQQRVMRDADALLRLSGHPNIVTAYPPFSWEHNKIVLAREWVDGYSLKGLLETHQPLTLAQKVDIVRQVASGLKHAHQNGVIHRNLRPDNLVIAIDGAVKLVNFDCARIDDSNLQTISGRISAQLDQRYVAPETWHGPSQASPVSDLYALGIIFFELLTGETPYHSIRDIVMAGGLPVLPAEVDPALPGEVDAIISGLCALRPEDRYAGSDEVLADLEMLMLKA
jgi:tRNA A-37 threonylcarbamoyl transferase component Bud32